MTDITVPQPAFSFMEIQTGGARRQHVRVLLSSIVSRFGQAVADQMVANAAQDSINAAARTYLASTDWYAVRFAETGVAIPEEIAAERAAQRAAVIAVDWTVDLTASPEDEPESEE
jgi:hypothetical protein